METPWTVLIDGEILSVEKISCLEFQTDEILDKIKKKTTKFLQRESKRKLNLFSTELFGEEFLENRVINHSVRFIDPLIGFGVFAEEKIPALSFVGEYLGIVRKRDKSQEIENPYIFRYLRCGLFTPLVIDAQQKGNFTRYINHSEYPNLSSRWIVVDGVYHIVFIANRCIEKGEQLTYNYGFGYWYNRAKPLEL